MHFEREREQSLEQRKPRVTIVGCVLNLSFSQNCFPVAPGGLTFAQTKLLIRLAQSSKTDRLGVFSLPSGVVDGASEKRQVYAIAYVDLVIVPELLAVALNANSALDICRVPEETL